MVNLNRKSKLFALILCFVLSIVTLSFNLTKTPAFAETATEYYQANKDGPVLLIDNETDLFFARLKDANDLATMKAIVAVATELQSLKDGYVEADYYPSDYKEVLRIIDRLNHDLLLTLDNYATYDADGSKTALVEGAKTELSAVLTIKADFDSHVKTAKAKLQAEFDLLFAANKANEGVSSVDHFNTVGYYDVSGAEELAEVLADANAAIDGVVFDGAKVQTLKTEINDLVKSYRAKLSAVAKNDLERAYHLYQDYVAVKGGSMEGDEQAALAAAKSATEALYSSGGYLKRASEEVKAEYATKINDLDALLKEDVVSGSIISGNVSELSDDKGIITVTARFGSVSDLEKGKVAPVFPGDAVLKVYSRVKSSAERNMNNALKELEMGLGYGLVWGVYKHSGYVDLEKIRENNAEGIYLEVSIDLNRYYDAYVVSEKSKLDEWLSAIGINGVWGAKDRLEDISEMSDKVGGKRVDDKSLCYSYKSGEIAPLNYTLNGGILMIYTENFGTLAVGSVDVDSLIANPIVWVILAAALIVIIVAIVHLIRHWKYRVVFKSNGGSKVRASRARKGEVFVMPANPVRKGFVFSGWFEDKALTRRFVKTRILKRRRLVAYAKWTLELTPDRVRSYYIRLRDMLASHAALGEGAVAIAEGDTKVYAVVTAEEKQIKLALDLEPKKLNSAGYKVTAVKADKKAKDKVVIPSLFTITTREDYLVAIGLIDKLIETHKLGVVESVAPVADDEVEYSLAISNVIPAVEETPVEEVVEEVVEETPVEEAPVEEVVEEPVEEIVEEVVEEPVSEEQLIEYFVKIRARASGYALYEANDKAEDGKVLVKLYKKDDEIKCYFALDPEAHGLESVILGIGDTPAMLSVDSDESFNKALDLVDIVMIEHGLERMDEEVEEKPYDGKNFGFRIHFVEEE